MRILVPRGRRVAAPQLVLLVFTATALLPLLSGCAHEAVGRASSEGTASPIGPGDKVVVLGEGHTDCVEDGSKPCSSPVHSESQERRLENSIWKAMQVSVTPNLRMPAADFRKTVFTGLDFQSAPHTPQTILTSLSDPATKSRLEASHIRYIVVVGSKTSNGTKSVKTVDGGAMPAIGVEEQWRRVGTVEAHVIDVSGATEVGGVMGTASENAKTGAALVVIIPVVVPDIDHTYLEACKAAGLELGKLITAGKPPGLQ